MSDLHLNKLYMYNTLVINYLVTNNIRVIKHDSCSSYLMAKASKHSLTNHVLFYSTIIIS